MFDPPNDSLVNKLSGSLAQQGGTERKADENLTSGILECAFDGDGVAECRPPYRLHIIMFLLLFVHESSPGHYSEHARA